MKQQQAEPVLKKRRGRHPKVSKIVEKKEEESDIEDTEVEEEDTGVYEVEAIKGMRLNAVHELLA